MDSNHRTRDLSFYWTYIHNLVLNSYMVSGIIIIIIIIIIIMHNKTSQCISIKLN